MTTNPPWRTARGDDPILATAIHAGHALRDEAANLVKLPDDERLREEDPFTDRWVDIARNTIVVDRSRFEVDLNRPRESAVYSRPEDAWGLEVWTAPLTPEFIEDSLALHDRFYAELGDICDELVGTHGRFVLLDVHSYNHRRSGPDRPVDDPEANPEINLGTESIGAAWRPVIDVLAESLATYPFDSGHLDVRENVRFKGGAMSRWVNARYGDRGCSIAIEVKKIFMDEWTGVIDEPIVGTVNDALTAGAVAIRELLGAPARQ